MKNLIPTVAVSLLGLAGTLPSAWAGLNAPVIRQDANIDPFLSTAGAQVAAANLGSTAPVTRNGVAFPAAGIGANPAGTNWSVTASTVDQSLGGFVSIDPLFFSESWGGNPVSLTVTNLNASKPYVVQILHGEPRSSSSGTFTSNDFLLSSGASLGVPGFTIGNGIAGENPPAASDRAIVEVELLGITSFTYRMKAGTGRGPSIAGFQVRELPTFTVTTTVDEDDGSGALNTPADISLREAVNHSPANSIIVFAPSLSGKTITLTQGQLLVTKSLTIDATSLPNGITINANGQSRVMEIRPNSTVALHGLTLTGGRATFNFFPHNCGGAIFANGWESGVSLSLYSCTLSDNSASNFGGGIYINGFRGSATLSLSSCTLSGNSAPNGGGIYSDGASGSATLSLSSCTLSGNSSILGGGGGGIYSDGGIYGNGASGSATLSLSSCTLSGNSSIGGGGGGIYSDGASGSATLSLSSCTLSGNFSSSFGGGIYSDGASGSATLSLSSSTLSGNSSNSGGGGIYSTCNNGGSATLSLSSCTLSGNSATYRSGGGIFSSGNNGGSATLSLSSCTLSGNSAEDDGGGIYSTCNFDGDRATLSRATLSLSSCTLSGNSARFGGGGGIFSIAKSGSATLSLSSCTLSGNSASNGGGIYNECSYDNASRVNNTAIAGSAELSLSLCTLSGNSAGNGGGIYSIVLPYNNTWVGTRATLNLSLCTLSGNSAAGSGGGIISSTGTYGGIAALSLYSCTLSGNSASQGGGIRLYTLAPSHDYDANNALILHNTILAANRASTGPDLLQDSNVHSSITATGNNLMSSLDDQSTLTVNTPGLILAAPLLAPLDYFGGPTQTMHPLSGSPAVLTSANVTRTDQRGFNLNGPPTIGAVMQGQVETVTGELNLRNLLANSANTKGRVIRFHPALNGQTIPLTDGQLRVPSLSEGLFIDASSLPNGITINANGAVTNHRVMEIQPNSTVVLYGLTLTGGNAIGDFPANSGGAIFANGSSSGNSVRLSLHSCTLSGNSATGNGGGIFSSCESGNATLSLSSCTLSGNSATGNGGGIFSMGIFGGRATLGLSSCTLSGNSARFDGGGIFCYGQFTGSATLNLHNTILAANSASNGPDLVVLDTTTTATGKNLISSLGDQASLTAGASVTVVPDPLLYPLGHYGGPVQTMPPFIGSPAIDAAGTTNPGGTDARGFPRFVDGNAAGGPQLDIGAVEAGPLHTVTTAVDENNGLETLSLREVITLYSDYPETRINFSSSLNGQTITLTGGQLRVSSNLFIDASSLPNGLTINANGAVTNHRVMEIQPNSTVALHGLTLTGGRATASYPGNNGGAIYADGSSSGNSVGLYLYSCTLSGNSALQGGGIYISGASSGRATLNLSSCTLSGNSVSFYGGGIFSNGNNGGRATLSLSSCTLSGNSASLGGGIYSTGASGSAALNLSSCTLSGNSASSFGGGISSTGTSGSAALNLNNTILAGNTASSSGPDLWLETTAATASGKNLISNLAGQISLTAGASVTVVPDPRLAPLANYGGPTQTMALRPGSLARNAATGSARTTDQRGFPIVGLPDIGAYEAGTLSNYNAFIWESLPNTATIAQTATSFDFDGDGQSNESEWNAGTLPADANSFLRITSLTRSGGNFVLTFPSIIGKSYTLWQNDTLTGVWMNTTQPTISGDDGIKQFTVPAPVAGVSKRFYRVQVGP